jgi:hypothetical protein
MSRKPSKAFTDTDFVMLRTPEEKSYEELSDFEVEQEGFQDPQNPADDEGFVAPEYQDFKPNDAETVNAFAIEEVPIPRSIRTKTLEYPIGTLTAGSNASFFVPLGESTFKALAASIRTFGYRNGFKVIIRNGFENGAGIRVWRKA